MNKNILITGASGNLGQTIVAAFKQADSFHINVVSREDVLEHHQFKTFHVDLLDEISAKSFVEEIIETQPPLDAVIFLTGGYVPGDITVNGSADFLKMMEVNVATAHNIARPLISLNRILKRRLTLIFVGARAAMDPASAVHSVAYALSKKTLHHYVSLINESENASGTSAHILLPGTIDTVFNRDIMPDADFSTWTTASSLALQMQDIIEGVQNKTSIEL